MVTRREFIKSAAALTVLTTAGIPLAIDIAKRGGRYYCEILHPDITFDLMHPDSYKEEMLVWEEIVDGTL